ncbi:TPA: glycosyltransferase [Morganella morganii]|nr:glycosyltransferase [Morganella morganii]
MPDLKIPFSVLMSVYQKESPVFFDECLHSLYIQTVTPTEVIIIIDGQITNELEFVIQEWKNKLPIKPIRLQENIGLGKALNIGLDHCSFEWVFRMDTDDICVYDRFEKQINYIEKNPDVSLVGGSIEEFSEDLKTSLGIRSIESNHNDIVLYAKKRSPFNHVTVAFKKSVIQKIGGYQHHLFMEDYNLWIRLLSKNYVTHNLPDILVNVRAGSSMISRRRGLIYVKSEIQLVKLKLDLNFDNKCSGIYIFSMRSIARLLPLTILKYLYKKFRT